MVEPRDNNGPVVSLRADDYFRQRSLLSNGSASWVIKERSKLCLISTGVTLYILFGAVAVVNQLGYYDTQAYELVDNSCSQNCSIQLDKSIRPWIFSFWFYFAYTIMASFLVVDVLRWMGKSSIVGDYAFGFHSVEIERLRPLGFILLLVPFLHMTYGFTLPVSSGSCCLWKPKRIEVIQKVRSLAFLLFVSGIFLLIDAHNHGYFVLRLSSRHRDAIELLRDALAKDADEGDGQNEALLANEDAQPAPPIGDDEFRPDEGAVVQRRR